MINKFHYCEQFETNLILELIIHLFFIFSRGKKVLVFKIKTLNFAKLPKSGAASGRWLAVTR